MSTLTIVLISIGGLLAMLVLSYGLYIVYMLRQADKPFPFDTGEPAPVLAEAIPLGDAAPGHALDIYGPGGEPDAPRPIVLFVPGDAPDALLRKSRGWGMWRSYAALCAERGWAAAVCSHRPSKSYKRCGDMLEDVRAALALLRMRAPALGLDPDRVVVWCFSGSTGPVLSGLLREPEPGVVGLMSFYGFLDLSGWPMKLPQDQVEAWSLPPLFRDAETLPVPVYLLHAEKDRKMMTKGFVATGQALKGKELPVTAVVGAGLRHGFEVMDPPERSRPAIEAGLDFAGRCLGG